jgi:antagonist of KipI
LGGLDGRTLQAGDELPRGALSTLSQRIADTLTSTDSASRLSSVSWYAGLSPLGEARALRVVRGNEYAMLDKASQKSLFSADFQVTADADRMGYRLSGPALSLAQQAEMISAAVCPGTIQAPPQGQPILLMADCATTGGYPKVAQVASVDLPLAGQLKPGDSFRLREISLPEAHNLYRRQEHDLRCLQTNLRLKFAV